MKPPCRHAALLGSLALALCLGQYLLRADATPNQPAPATAERSEVERDLRARAAPEALKTRPEVASHPTVPAHRAAGYRPAVDTGARDYHGEAATVSCMTCHATRQPDPQSGMQGATPQTFHQGLKYAHAAQSCLMCHNADDYDSLRLANGGAVPFAAAQQLCAQCHGPQTRDYLNGSHGGMNGYWSLAHGGRTRNTCTDCHDPHAPAYPNWTPIFAPRDEGARQQARRDAAKPAPARHD